MKMDNDMIQFLILANAFMLLAAFVVWRLVIRHARHVKKHYLQVKEMELAHEKALIAARLEMRDLTFQEVAQELHDNIKSNLTVSKLNLHSVHAFAGGENDPMIEQSIEILDKAIKDIGDLSRSLNTDWLKGIGLISALEMEVEKLNHTGRFTLESNFSYHQVVMEPDKELSIFRIVQEAFNNIITHSGAEKIMFSLQYTTTRLYCTITDDGKGFQANGVARSGTGLHNMQLRAKALGARLVIDSVPGKGTTISLTVPYKAVTDQQTELRQAEGEHERPSFNFFQRIVMVQTFLWMRWIDAIWFAILNQFLPEQLVWHSLIALSTLYIFYGVIAWKKNFDRFTRSFPAMKLLVMGKTRNLICVLMIQLIIIYGLWIDNTYFMLIAAIPAVILVVDFWRNEKAIMNSVR